MASKGSSLFSLERFSLGKREHVGVFRSLGFGFAFVRRNSVDIGELITSFSPVAFTSTAAVTIVTSTRGVATIEFTSRALTAFAAFAATAARGAGVTFMITAAASRVEAFAAFGADDFAFEFTSRLRRLRPVTGVTLSGSGSCLNERSS